MTRCKDALLASRHQRPVVPAENHRLTTARHHFANLRVEWTTIPVRSIVIANLQTTENILYKYL